MALQLVTGPVNASKAGVVLGLARRWAAAGRSPLVVVPTGPDADAYRRELLGGRGVVLDVDVVTFGRLEALAREAAGISPPAVGAVPRDRALAAALAASAEADDRRRRPLAATSDRRGVRRRLLALLDELTVRGADVEALAAALDAPPGGGPGTVDGPAHGVDRALVDDLRVVVGGFARRLATLAADRPDAPADRAAAQRDVAAAIAAEPRERWTGRPVALYGFDDLTGPQERLVASLARATDVVVSLPFEDGRPGTAARRDLVERLRRAAGRGEAASRQGEDALPLGPGHPLVADRPGAVASAAEVRLPPARRAGAIGRLADALFAAPDAGAPGPSGPGDPRDPDPGDVPGDAPGGDGGAGGDPAASDVELVVAGDPRAEAEAVADGILAAAAELDAPWGAVAVAVRDAAGPAGARFERELRERGVPVARPHEVEARRTTAGRAALALTRLADGRGTGADAVAVLRASVDGPRDADRVDRLAARASRTRATEPAAVLQLAREGQVAPEASALVEAALAADGATAAALGPIAALLPAVLAAFTPGTAPDGRDVEAGAAAAIGGHLDAVGALADAMPDALPTLAELEEDLAALPVPAGHPTGRGRLEIAEPAALRGRQLQVLAVAGLDERAFPAPEPVDPLVDRDARLVLEAAGSVVLAVPPERLAAERLLFLELVARPTGRLLLSRPATDGGGAELPRSPFLADVEEALGDVPVRRRRRGAGDVRAPTRRAVASTGPLGGDLAPAGAEAVRRTLGEHARFTVREVELLVRCPVCWLVESFVGAADTEPEAEPLRQGTVVHDVLQRVVREVAEIPRYGDLDPDDLEAAGRAALASQGTRLTAGLPPHAAAILVRRTEAAVVGVLRALPERFANARPYGVEVTIGDGEELPPIDLGDGASAVGRIDRVDLVPGDDGDPTAVGVVDYKLGAGGATAHARWDRTATLQAALYLHAAAVALQARCGYALYQRTTVAAGSAGVADTPKGVQVAKLLGPTSRGLATADDVEAVVGAATARAREAVAALRGGSVVPDPVASVHGRDGGCRHPVVARLLA